MDSGDCSLPLEASTAPPPKDNDTYQCGCSGKNKVSAVKDDLPGALGRR